MLCHHTRVGAGAEQVEALGEMINGKVNDAQMQN